MNRQQRDDWWLIPAVLIGGWGIWWALLPPQRPYNPEVFVAFRAAETHCLAELSHQQTARCQRVLTLIQECGRRSGAGECSADEYHDGMIKAGFDLPPLHPVDAAR